MLATLLTGSTPNEVPFPSGSVQLGVKAAVVDYRGEVVEVGTAGGGRYRARAVVVTVPHAALVGSAITFVPGLPAGKIRGLGRMGMDNALKVWLVFEERAWSEVSTTSKTHYTSQHPPFWFIFLFLHERHTQPTCADDDTPYAWLLSQLQYPLRLE